MIQTTKMAKIVENFSTDIATRATYKLNGIEQNAEIATNVSDNTIKVTVQLDSNISGTVSNICLYDSDNTLSSMSNLTFHKPQGKRMYVAISFQLEERSI